MSDKDFLRSPDPLLPKWAANAILESCKTESWSQLLYEINEGVQTSINSFSLALFSDLTESEQFALVEKEFREVRQTFSLVLPCIIR
jgi:hypothetical protein